MHLERHQKHVHGSNTEADSLQYKQSMHMHLEEAASMHHDGAPRNVLLIVIFKRVDYLFFVVVLYIPLCTI
jgi:hypothetical protein